MRPDQTDTAFRIKQFAVGRNESLSGKNIEYVVGIVEAVFA